MAPPPPPHAHTVRLVSEAAERGRRAKRQYERVQKCRYSHLPPPLCFSGSTRAPTQRSAKAKAHLGEMTGGDLRLFQPRRAREGANAAPGPTQERMCAFVGICAVLGAV